MSACATSHEPIDEHTRPLIVLVDTAPVADRGAPWPADDAEVFAVFHAGRVNLVLEEITEGGLARFVGEVPRGARGLSVTAFLGGVGATSVVDLNDETEITLRIHDTRSPVIHTSSVKIGGTVEGAREGACLYFAGEGVTDGRAYGLNQPLNITGKTSFELSVGIFSGAEPTELYLVERESCGDDYMLPPRVLPFIVDRERDVPESFHLDLSSLPEEEPPRFEAVADYDEGLFPCAEIPIRPRLSHLSPEDAISGMMGIQVNCTDASSLHISSALPSWGRWAVVELGDPFAPRPSPPMGSLYVDVESVTPPVFPNFVGASLEVLESEHVRVDASVRSGGFTGDTDLYVQLVVGVDEEHLFSWIILSREREKVDVDTEALGLDIERFGEGARVIQRTLRARAGYGVPLRIAWPRLGPTHHAELLLYF